MKLNQNYGNQERIQFVLFECCTPTSVDVLWWTLPAVEAAEEAESSDVPPGEITRMPSDVEDDREST